MKTVFQNYHPAPQRQPAPHHAHAPAPAARANRNWWFVASLIIAVIFLLMIAYGLWKATTSQNHDMSTVETNKYQAVFLTNNQVYFGKIQSFNGQTVKLTNIYYLQANQNAQQNGNPQQSQNQNQNLSLVKLGSELHAPEDVMYIDRKQVLFWENLKDDGKVVQAIKGNQAQGSQNK